jgi:quinol monooxygenase YgiN
MSSQKLTIVANIHAKADKIGLVKTELEKLIEPTLAEEGCINYDLHLDNENPAHFMFYENWESRELWQVHMNNDNLANFIAATDGALESLTVNEMTHIV